MIQQLLIYLRYTLGAERDAAGATIADTSWSEQLQSSEYLWMLLEGAHVVTLMLFAGTILLVDLRLLGWAFRSVPVSRISAALLPYTVAGFAVMIVTGLGLFFANPIEYFYNFVFRLKVAVLLIAAVNIFLFHVRARRDGARWDAAAVPPRSVRVAAGISLTTWIAVIAAGRYLAYDWFSCEGAGRVIAAASGCATRARLLADATGSAF